MTENKFELKVERCHYCGKVHPIALTPWPDDGILCPYDPGPKRKNVTTVTNTPPEKIYLQWEEYSTEGVTWSHERENDSDVEYVLAERIAELEYDVYFYRNMCREFGEVID